MNCLPVLALLFLASCSGVAQPGGNLPRQAARHAAEIACEPSGRDPHHVGVVIVHAGHTFEAGDDKRHGIFGGPPAGKSVAGLARTLEQAGFHVAMPEMPWTIRHQYDRSFEEALDEIAAAVERLQAEGAELVVIAGHSFGGGAVIGFGALRGGIGGVVAMAAGPDPAGPVQLENRADSVAKAEAMMASGRADEIAPFDDFDEREAGIVLTTPAHYLSFFSPRSQISLHRNLARWPSGLPLLWIDGNDEARYVGRERMVRSRLRYEPLTRYLIVPTSHNMVADVATDTVVAWIQCL